MIQRPLQIVITFKTLLLAVALLPLTWAVISIRDTLLVVSVGIFLGLKAGAAALLPWCAARFAFP